MRRNKKDSKSLKRKEKAGKRQKTKKDRHNAERSKPNNQGRMEKQIGKERQELKEKN